MQLVEPKMVLSYKVVNQSVDMLLQLDYKLRPQGRMNTVICNLAAAQENVFIYQGKWTKPLRDL